MRGLESDLGVRLLHRMTRSVSLTDAGETLLARLRSVLGDLDRALDDVARDDSEVRGTLRINGSEGAIRQLLQTVVPRFLSAYPHMELDLVADGRLSLAISTAKGSMWACSWARPAQGHDCGARKR
ncbi:Transcriptional regulator, LysR family [Candidatus Paraburkholderia calva]|nr:Transcriptional regulator, LysR family [Candidatus Paraburkholderia calva]